MRVGMIDFADDEPIDCDCGCTIYAGHEYKVIKFTARNSRTREFETVRKSWCGKDACLMEIFDDYLEDVEEMRVKSASDKADEYADMEGD